MRMQSFLSLIGGLAALILATLPVSAHHGWSGNSEHMTLSGTVVSPVSLSGPHATMQIRDADGKVWDITLAPAPRTHRAGLEEDTIPEGAQVTLRGQRNADPDRYEMKTRQVVWNDREFNVYPPR